MVTARAVPPVRIHRANARPLRRDGDWVLYWMIASRRTRRSFALQRAIEWCEDLGKPLLVLEPLRAGYPHASDRIHRFVLDGMRDDAAAFAAANATYYPYVEPRPGDGSGLLEALAARACVVVTDEFPAFFLPRMVRAAASRVPVWMEEVDGNGVVPLRAPGRLFTYAHSFRRWQLGHLAEFLGDPPEATPLSRTAALPAAIPVPRDILARWTPPSPAILAGDLSSLAIDHDVPPVPQRGGALAAAARLSVFVSGARRYEADRNEPDRDGTSGLSPWLHFGHLSSFDVLAALDETGPRAPGFVDQLVTWRELGLNFCFHRPDDYARFDSLPEWARRSLLAHRKDPRPVTFTRGELDRGETGDRVWDAAQRQLLAEGRIHNRLRMVWGKKVIEWSRSPRDAFDWLIETNDRFAIDGRDPNSYSGIGWCFGRYDRPWFERPVFGKVRPMSTTQAAKKLELGRYLDRWAPNPAPRKEKPSQIRGLFP